MTVSQVELRSFQIPTPPAYSRLLNSVLQDIRNAFQKKRTFLGDLSDLPLQIIFHTWWAFINLGFQSSSG